MAAFSVVNRAGTELTFPLHLMPSLETRGAIPDLPNTLHKVKLNKALSEMKFYSKV
jgi:hypothetical protein